MAGRLVPIDPQAVDLAAIRIFSKQQRRSLYERAGGRCEVIIDDDGDPIPPTVAKAGRRCNRELGARWIAGHYPQPYHEGGKTTLDNGRCECRLCAARTAANDKTGAAKARRRQLFQATGKTSAKKKRAKIPVRPFPSKSARRRFRAKIVRRSR